MAEFIDISSYYRHTFDSLKPPPSPPPTLHVMQETSHHSIGNDFDYCVSKGDLMDFPSPLHTEQHFTALPSNWPTISRHGWQASRSSQNTPRSSIDWTDNNTPQSTATLDLDEDFGFCFPSNSLSTSIDSLSSYSQYTPDTPAFSVDTFQKPPALKRRVSTAPTFEAKQDNDYNEHEAQNFPLPPLARRLSTRYLPQSQAILQTDVHGHIVAMNETAVSLFGSKQTLLKMRAIELLETNFRVKYFTNMLDKFTHNRLARDAINPNNDDKPYTTILLSGKVVPIITKDGPESVASLWLKEKHSSASEISYVWIFEEISESMISLHVNASAIIERVEVQVEDLYGYSDATLIGRSIELLIPGWSQMRLASDSGFYDMMYDDTKTSNETTLRSDHRRLDIDRINSIKFFGCRNAYDAAFPVMTKIQDSPADRLHLVKIISMPTITGLVTILMDGTIKSSNAVFTKYLFGYDLTSVLDQNIAKLLPQIPHLLLGLQTQKLLRVGYKLNHEACYSVFSKYNPPSSYFQTDSKMKAEQRCFVAVHRDSTLLQVQLQLKTIQVDEIALWIEFDRPKRPQRQTSHVQEQQLQTLQVTKTGIDDMSAFKPPKPLGTISSFGSPSKKVAQVSALGGASPTLPRRISYATVVAPHVNANLPKYSAQTLATSIDNYVTIDTFGQGAYGVVKLAQHKTNLDQRRVVIKYVVKSRILVDCWTRDRVLGMLPLEIHTLHTLRRIPHPNICQMVDYFEDDDHYYIVMNLHGEGMDLFDYIEYQEQLSQHQVRSIFQQVALAVQHLHHNKIVHRDIKDENVIIDRNQIVQLIDFGSSAYVKPDRMFERFSGTLDYAAPEILNGSPYQGPPQDIWSLGILLYTLVFKENPFYNIDQAVSRELPKLRDVALGWRGATELMQSMLCRNIDDRPTIDEVLAHPWLQPSDAVLV